MYRIDNDSAVTELPTPGAIGPNPDGYFSPGDPEEGAPATVVSTDWANAVQEEICGVIEGSGLTLDKTDQGQLLEAIKLIISGGAGDYVASTTAANTYTATLSPASSAYAAGQFITVKFTNHNTGAATINFNSLGAKNIYRQDGTALTAYDIVDSMIALLVYDGTQFILCNAFKRFAIQNDEANYAASTTAANTYTATLAPAPTAYTTGMRVSIKFTNTNTNAATINLNSLGAKSIVTISGSALAGGEIASGMIADLRYDGTNFQLLNNAQVSVTKSDIQSESYVYAASTTAANTYTASLTPAPSSYTTGMRCSLKFTNHNTGAATINLNSLGAQSIKLQDGSALVGSEISDGMIADLRYDGTNFQLMNKFDLVATKSQQETGTNTTSFVSPSIQQEHNSAIKAWLMGTHSAGTPTITTSWNISSLTDSGPGLVTANLSVTFSSANYCPMWTGGLGASNYTFASNQARTATTSAAAFTNAGNTVEDVSVSFFTFTASGVLA
jgi:hypothetical protein